MSRLGIAESASTVEEVTHAGFVWQERYNVLNCRLNKWFLMTIAWTSGEGYKVTVGGVTYKARFSDREQAAQFAVDKTKGMLSEALKQVSR